ncbi:hypothetical protein PHYBOEH_009842 [Phytophthora boehmeriae]|uniref:non-specific serine/threonine protein kinase n=1 Tax=Phytophthora boehmeriae TaxID=109152 RepID=A0A8T1X1I4_9STRA|nr:hypothetical protein PHYBOEH_009842 [Phytophthora boehmeriae]
MMKQRYSAPPSGPAPSTALLLQQPRVEDTRAPSHADIRRKQLGPTASATPESHRSRRHRRQQPPTATAPSSAPAAPSFQHLGAIESVRTALSSTGSPSAVSGTTHEVILSGALNKRGQFFKTWLPRHLVLSRNALQVYRKNPYSASIQQQEKDVATLEKKLLKMEVARADALRVEATDSFKHHPFCFVLVARKRSRRRSILSTNRDSTTRSTITFSSTGGSCLHRKESNLDARRVLDDGPVVLYYLQASKEAERQRWMRALQRWIDGESPAKLGRSILNYIVNNEYSNFRYGQKVVGSASSSRSNLMDCGASVAGPGVMSPAAQAGRTVEQEFPVLANLIRDMYDCKSEDEMVYILDQILGEVLCGANSGYIKKLIASAGEVKLEEAAHVWTDHVKTAYAEIMKALQVASSGQNPSTQAPTLRAPTAMRQNSVDSAESGDSNRSLNNVDLASFHRFYKLGRKLGSGAFSVVHIATHRETRKQVAVKCIAKASLGVQDVHSLKQEVEVMSSLDHPNIVPLLDYFEEDRYYYIVTPLCTGDLLTVDRHKRLDASGILAHPWMDPTRASVLSITDEESKKRITRKCSDLLPALLQMRKHSLTHGSPKIRLSDMNVDDIELDELTMNSDKALLERELADMEGF